MLPTTIHYNEPFKFVTCTRQGLHIVFASAQMLASKIPCIPLWDFECGNVQSLNAVKRWVDVRRSEWAAWGDLATKKGFEAFDVYMKDLMAKEPIEAVLAAVVRAGNDDRSLTLGHLLSGRTGITVDVLHRHRFATPAARKRFFDWFKRGSNAGQADVLLKIALDSGTNRLSEALEVLAQTKGRRTSAVATRPSSQQAAA